MQFVIHTGACAQPLPLPSMKAHRELLKTTLQSINDISAHNQEQNLLEILVQSMCRLEVVITSIYLLRH